VRTRTIGVELPAVIRTTQASIRDVAVTESGVAVRAHVEERLHAVAHANDDEGLTDQFHARGCFPERFDATNRMPRSTQL
jgi:hypothetical protein